MLTKIQKFMERRRTVHELHSLTDRQLRDMGITRCEIKARVYGKG